MSDENLSFTIQPIGAGWAAWEPNAGDCREVSKKDAPFTRAKEASLVINTSQQSVTVRSPRCHLVCYTDWQTLLGQLTSKYRPRFRPHGHCS
jgi:hypothetical protein